MSLLPFYVFLAIYSFLFIFLLVPLFLLLRKYQRALKIETPPEKTNFFCFRRHDSIHWKNLKLIEFVLGMVFLVPFRLFTLILLTFMVYLNAKIFNYQLKIRFIRKYLQLMVRLYCKSILFISGFYYIPCKKKNFPSSYHYPPPSSSPLPPPSSYSPSSPPYPSFPPSSLPPNSPNHPSSLPPPPSIFSFSSSLFHPSHPPPSLPPSNSLPPLSSLHPPSAIIISNHVSWVDGFFLLSRYPSSIIAKKELSKIPLIGEIAKCVEPIFVSRDDRKDKDFVLNRIKESVERFNQTKTHLIIFPEGTTSNGQALLSFKRGAFASLSALKVFCLKYSRTSFCPVLDHISSMGVNVILTLCQFYNVLEVVEYEASYQEEGGGGKKEEERKRKEGEGGSGGGGEREQKKGEGQETKGREEEMGRGKVEKGGAKEEGEGVKDEERRGKRKQEEGWEEYARKVKEVMSKELGVTMVELGLRESLEYSNKVKEKLKGKLKKEGEKKLDLSKVHAVRVMEIN